MHVNLLWKSNAGSELRSSALYCAFEHFGNTGENIKRMQGTRESPKISVIEIQSSTLRPARMRQQVLRDAATAYKVDVNTIALKVKQEFAAKEKARPATRGVPQKIKKSA
jgi:hypothetical protein